MTEHEHATKKKPETKPAQNEVVTKASAEGKTPPAEPNHHNDQLLNAKPPQGAGVSVVAVNVVTDRYTIRRSNRT